MNSTIHGDKSNIWLPFSVNSSKSPDEDHQSQIDKRTIGFCKILIASLSFNHWQKTAWNSYGEASIESDRSKAKLNDNLKLQSQKKPGIIGLKCYIKESTDECSLLFFCWLISTIQKGPLTSDDGLYAEEQFIFHFIFSTSSRNIGHYVHTEPSLPLFS